MGKKDMEYRATPEYKGKGMSWPAENAVYCRWSISLSWRLAKGG